jgi:hypothetical protein
MRNDRKRRPRGCPLSEQSPHARVTKNTVFFGDKTPVSTRCRRSNPEITDMWLPTNGSWLLGSMGGMVGTAALSLPLGSHHNLSGGTSGLEN